jgi:hypothetical protein
MRSTVGSALLLAMWVMLVLAPAAAHATGSGPPVNSVLPKISGTAQDGQTLKAAKGTWTGSATITYTYQWHLCDNTGQNCTNIPLATKTSYKLGHETVGHTLRVIVIATNTLGKASATSAPSAVVAPVPPHETKLPAIKGTPKVGALLTASTGTWTGTPPITYGYQWEACNSTGEACGAIAGATTATFTPGPTQAAATLRVVVGAGNVAGYASATSVPTKAVIPQACTISWTGNAGTSTWVTAGNWSPARLPSSTDVVCVAGSMLEAPVVYAGGTTKIAELVTTRPLSVTGGELSVTSTTTPSFVTDLTLAGGALTGEGALTIEGASEWSGGALGFRSATVSAGSSLQLISGHGEPIVASGRTLANNGTVTVEGSTGLRLEGSARVVNSGTFDFLGEGGIRYSGSFPPYLDSIVNSGVFEKTAGSTNEISGIFDNTGTVSVSSGGMWLDGPSSSGQGDTGSYTTTSSGHVVFYVETGDRTLAPASKLTGNVEWATGLLDGTVSAGSSLQLISGHGEPIVASGRTLTIAGTLVAASSTTLPVEPGSHVAFAAGSAFKAGTAAGIRVMPEGDLTAEGVAGAPVSFTSANDNSVGGTTGSGSPAPGDWSGIEAQSGSTVSLTGASLRYASTALYVAEEAEATIHGKLLNDTVGVSSPGAYVDATEVDWGSSSGPAPIGSGTPVEGDGVLVIPWVGYRAPPKPPPPQITNPPTNTCPAVFFIGVRGSGEYSREREPYSTQTADQERLLGSKIGWAYKAVQDALAPQTVQPVAVEYPALPFLGSNVGKDIQVVWSLANTEYVDNLWEGAWVTEGVLGDAEANCPTSKIILAGYSSGAFAVHEGLNNLTSAEAKRVAAVILLADPSKLRPGEEPKVTTEGTAKTSADGIYTKTFGNGLGDLTGINPTKIPQSVEAKTISWCNDHDPVCAFGKGIKPSVHSAYSQSELEYLGNWAAQRYEAGS